MAKPIWQSNQKKIYAQAYLNSPPFMIFLKKKKKKKESYRMPACFFFRTKIGKIILLKEKVK